MGLDLSSLVRQIRDGVVTVVANEPSSQQSAPVTSELARVMDMCAPQRMTAPTDEEKALHCPE
jgi:hypothetical protein